MKKIIGIGLLLLLVGGIVAYYYTQHDHRNAIRSAAPDVTMSAVEIFELFETDEDKANETLLGKTVLIEGVVSSVTNTEDSKSVTLESGEILGEVVCELNPNLVEDLSLVKEGSVIKVKGECSGKLMDVIFVNCIIE